MHTSLVDGFQNFRGRGQTIEGYYVEGISVTHGSPRNHIWTFTAGLSKDYNYPSWNCPCASPYPGPAAPSFVGENFSVSLGTQEHGTTSGTLMTLCGTHRGVQVGAPAVIVVVRGSLPHYLKQSLTTLK